MVLSNSPSPFLKYSLFSRNCSSGFYADANVVVDAQRDVEHEHFLDREMLSNNGEIGGITRRQIESTGRRMNACKFSIGGITLR